MDGEPESNKALSWLILALNQQDELYYCFQLIFTNGSFLMYYSEEASYLFRNRDQLLGICRNIYGCKLFVTSVQYVKYQEFVEKALRERAVSNQFNSSEDRSGPDLSKHEDVISNISAPDLAKSQDRVP